LLSFHPQRPPPLNQPKTKDGGGVKKDCGKNKKVLLDDDKKGGDEFKGDVEVKKCELISIIN
jgi:hypothetical protein